MTTGERVVTADGGFNPTWQRHVAAYRLCAPHLPDGEVVDLGCGVGHSYLELAPRKTVGVDIDPAVLRTQPRPTVQADMRALPFEDGLFAGALSVHSLEHVPDPERILAEAKRVVAPGGTVIFVTPNRLTFSPGEIVDPYHWIEFDAQQLETLCRATFDEVQVLGLFGSERYVALWDADQERARKLLALDPLRIRDHLPRRALQWLYDTSLTVTRRNPDPASAEITPEDFRLGDEALDRSMDLVAVCRSS